MDWQTVFLTIGGGAVTALAAWNRYLMAKLSELKRDIWSELDHRKDACHATHQQITKEYASVAHLQEVERRLQTVIDRIEGKLDRLPQEIIERIVAERKIGIGD